MQVCAVEIVLFSFLSEMCCKRNKKKNRAIDTQDNNTTFCYYRKYYWKKIPFSFLNISWQRTYLVGWESLGERWGLGQVTSLSLIKIHFFSLHSYHWSCESKRLKQKMFSAVTGNWQIDASISESITSFTEYSLSFIAFTLFVKSEFKMFQTLTAKI